MKFKKTLNEKNVAFEKNIAFSQERKEGHDSQVIQVAQALADAGLKGRILVFGKRSTHDDMKDGDMKVDEHKIDHKSPGRDGFFVSYRSGTRFEGEYYSTLDKGEPVFVDVAKSQIKSRIKQTEEKGGLKTATGHSSDNSEEAKRNGYRIQIDTPEGKKWRDLGARFTLPEVNYLTLEEFVKKMNL
jgi:hypothetical protein